MPLQVANCPTSPWKKLWNILALRIVLGVCYQFL